MSYRLLSTILFAVVLLPAAIVPRLGLEDLIDQSEFIVEGTVVEARPAWDDSHNHIWTHYRVAVADSLKSAAPSVIEVSVPGGQLDGVAMGVPGSISLSEGEEVLLFLYRTPVGYLRATGYGQGKYSIVTDAATGVRHLGSSLRGMSLVDLAAKPSESRRATSLETVDGMSVDEFKSLIREIAKEEQ